MSTVTERSVQLFDSIESLRTARAKLRAAGKSLAFVPTMGNLHAGHIALVKHAAERASCVVVSIFVNPLQFGPLEDFANYPRTLESDCAKLDAAGVDYLFVPDVPAIYPAGTTRLTEISMPELESILCGAERPGHFSGVLAVVARLFHIVEPDVAVFGEKDYQQLTMIRKMVSDLAFPIEIDGVETVREEDGLALSSRNQYLTPAERQIAPTLHKTLKATAAKLRAGAVDYPALERSGLRELMTAGFRPGYFSIRNADDLSRPAKGTSKLIVLTAARLGNARLIDNVVVST